MKIDDWVTDKHGNIGQVERLAMPFDEQAVQVIWKSLPFQQVRSPFAKRKYLTVITKEVADIIRSSHEFNNSKESYARTAY
jgi:hypothetical protein